MQIYLADDRLFYRSGTLLLAGALWLSGSGCQRSLTYVQHATVKRAVIQNIGSDTMVNLAQAWANDGGADGDRAFDPLA